MPLSNRYELNKDDETYVFLKFDEEVKIIRIVDSEHILYDNLVPIEDARLTYKRLLNYGYT